MRRNVSRQEPWRFTLHGDSANLLIRQAWSLMARRSHLRHQCFHRLHQRCSRPFAVSTMAPASCRWIQLECHNFSEIRQMELFALHRRRRYIARLHCGACQDIIERATCLGACAIPYNQYRHRDHSQHSFSKTKAPVENGHYTRSKYLGRSHGYKLIARETLEA